MILLEVALSTSNVLEKQGPVWRCLDFVLLFMHRVTNGRRKAQLAILMPSRSSGSTPVSIVFVTILTISFLGDVTSMDHAAPGSSGYPQVNEHNLLLDGARERPKELPTCTERLRSAPENFDARIDRTRLSTGPV